MLKSGFSLFEVLIVMLITGILAAIAIPSYQHHLIKARRTEAISQLWMAAGQLEAYYGEHHRYTEFNGEAPSLSLSLNVYYHFQVIATSTTYMLSAVPQGSQTADSACGTLTLTDTGARSASGTTPDRCW